GFVVESRIAGGVDHSVGIAFTIAALISLVVGTILFKKFAPAHGHWIGNGVQNLSAGLTTLPFALTFENVGDIVPSGRLLAAVAYLALFVSVFAYLLWFHMLTVSRSEERRVGKSGGEGVRRISEKKKSVRDTMCTMR